MDIITLRRIQVQKHMLQTFLSFLSNFFSINTLLSMEFRAGVGVECIDMQNIGHEIK